VVQGKIGGYSFRCWDIFFYWKVESKKKPGEVSLGKAVVVLPLYATGTLE